MVGEVDDNHRDSIVIEGGLVLPVCPAAHVREVSVVVGRGCPRYSRHPISSQTDRTACRRQRRERWSSAEIQYQVDTALSDENEDLIPKLRVRADVEFSFGDQPRGRSAESNVAGTWSVRCRKGW